MAIPGLWVEDEDEEGALVLSSLGTRVPWEDLETVVEVLVVLGLLALVLGLWLLELGLVGWREDMMCE